jgi:hypothetical protein
MVFWDTVGCYPVSIVPGGTWFLSFLLTQGLRPGLYSVAASRLGSGPYAALKRRSSTVVRAVVIKAETRG